MGSPLAAQSSFPVLNRFGPPLPRVDVHPRQHPACTQTRACEPEEKKKGNTDEESCLGQAVDFPGELISELSSPVSTPGQKRLNRVHESVCRRAESQHCRSPVACPIYRHLRKFVSGVRPPGAMAVWYDRKWKTMCIFRLYRISCGAKQQNQSPQYVWSHTDVSNAYDVGMRAETQI